MRVELGFQLKRELIINKRTKFHYIPILQFIVWSMNLEESFSDDLTKNLKPRDFKCPCGKTYLSYAALFTHIKQKHEGKAPGKITKPPSLHDKRGRPPIKPKTDQTYKQKTHQTHTSPPTYSPAFPLQTEEQKFQREQMAEGAIVQLAQLLDSMPQEQLNKQHLNEIQAFCEMNVYLNTRLERGGLANGNICIADGFIQFSQTICQRILWRHFQPLYLVFMLFLQYMMDEQNSKKMLTESNMDLFCEYVNEFVEQHAKEMAQYYGLQNLWIMQKQNSVRIFYKFFLWCTHKRYLTYKISLAKREQSSQRHQPAQTVTCS